ncbi:zinc finger SWIM domain-containing protein 7 isoform X2 [Phycodurus eques]|uniref:zinc finger SWIM domain-containing protein 7 isoform X2 n=1 Tax=Phycodurus eques TaxID=693459 RepID=UPI002ACDF7DF|nr:zinc finger SWIM domain-containing protein 7 isoform X2 [Phycodurus eques]
MPVVLPVVAEQLFRDIRKTYRETSQNVQCAVTSAASTLNPPLLSVREFECRCMTVTAELAVAGASGGLYTCFSSCHYCSCPAFAYAVLRRNEGLLCKHIVAVYLCEATGVTRPQSASDEQMTALLSGTSSL